MEEQTTEALSSLSEGNKALLEQQQYLKDAQVTAHMLVKMNLKELNNEKALIRSGHTQLAVMTEDIKNKLGMQSIFNKNRATKHYSVIIAFPL